MMNSTDAVSVGIVHEVLNKDNYERWKCYMENYLKGQGLWDVVVGNPDHASKKMSDEKAFYVFQLSYGREFLEKLKISSLNNHFTNQDGTESKANPDHDLEQGLWGFVQSVSEVESTKASWESKNAKALHIIQLSCVRKIGDEISRINTAKKAWNHLGTLYSNELNLKASARTKQAKLNDSLSKNQKAMFRQVERGDDIGNIIMDSDIYMTSGANETLLHVAVIAGNTRNVKKLVKKGRDRLVHMQDKQGDTALGLVARYTGRTDIAKCMVETKNGVKLLTMENKEGVIPIFHAAANGHKELTTYLYSKSVPLKVFDDSEKRVLLLSLCIAAKIFDVALRLLKRYDDLAKESLSSYKLNVPMPLREALSLSTNTIILEPNDQHKQSKPADKYSILVTLAKMPSIFPSGTRFWRPKQFVYDVLCVETEFKENYEIPNIGMFVRMVTSVAAVPDEKPLQKTFYRRFGIREQVLDYLHFFGLHFYKLPWIILVLLVKILGLPHRICCGIGYVFVHIYKFLNIFGVRKIYEQKYSHYEVIAILSYLCASMKDFDESQLQDASASEAMLHAGQHGIIEFINTMKEANPDLLTVADSLDRDIFSYSILYRKQNVFQLVHSLRGQKEKFRYRKDTFGNNMLHLAAQLGPLSDRDNRSGAALQMQREILWFKAVENVVNPKFMEAKNTDGKKPYEIFTENHDELVKAGEKWAKDTATSYTIVGTLITTIMFAAAFTVPGGNDQNTGLPIFLHDYVFAIFLVADAFSLLTAATSVLVFIGILTSRFAEKDFHKNLPWKLLLGLLFTSLSVCSMIIAFCAAINIILKGYHITSSWFVLLSTMLVGSVPIIFLVLPQLRLMYDILHSSSKNPAQAIR